MARNESYNAEKEILSQQKKPKIDVDISMIGDVLKLASEDSVPEAPKTSPVSPVKAKEKKDKGNDTEKTDAKPAKSSAAKKAAAPTSNDVQTVPQRRRGRKKVVGREIRSFRTSLNVTESMKNRIDEAVDTGRMPSLNDFVNRALDDYFSGKYDPYENA